MTAEVAELCRRQLVDADRFCSQSWAPAHCRAELLLHQERVRDVLHGREVTT